MMFSVLFSLTDLYISIICTSSFSTHCTICITYSILYNVFASSIAHLNLSSYFLSPVFSISPILASKSISLIIPPMVSSQACWLFAQWGIFTYLWLIYFFLRSGWKKIIIITRAFINMALKGKTWYYNIADDNNNKCRRLMFAKPCIHRQACRINLKSFTGKPIGKYKTKSTQKNV